MAARKKLPQDTRTWLFAFKIVSTFWVLMIAAAIWDGVHLYHFLQSLYAGKI